MTVYTFTVTLPEEIGDSVKRKKHFTDGIKGYLSSGSEILWTSTTCIVLKVPSGFNEAEIFEKVNKILTDQEKNTLETPLSRIWM